MANILFCGCNAGERQLIEELARYGRLQYCDTKSLWQKGGEGTDFYLYQYAKPPETQGIGGVALLGSALKEGGNPLDEHWIPIFESNNEAAVRLLSAAGGAAISCGTSPKDTFSPASIGDEKAVISLQRNIPVLGGGVMEPRDMPVHLTKKRPVFEIMAFCAVLCVCGVENKEILL